MNSTELANRIIEVGNTYVGQTDPFRNAIGVAFMCQIYGWRVAKLVHSYKAWKLYQKILGIDFEKEFPDKTHMSSKSVAFGIWQASGRFWDTMQGKVRFPEKRRDFVELDA